ncbi:LytTR family DNA-binding domain-containing protein [Metallibacterium sp.]|uniref:LytR/AlgR family response regulator transcription factor n=1 Tax=Metallibacterium sp. TaxID=2940281 RepID=UPI002621126F|nr:LytTR family DNA-binding domain-containing protein [Metallibacterium sp.]
MRVLIADDEPLARARLQALLRDCAGAELVGSVGSARAALEALPVLKPTVLLLDIEMPGVDGLALAERIARLTPPPQVIFCTAYAQHALRAYELKAADYLLKPVRIERLREALERARRLHAESAAARPHLSGMVRGMRQRVPLDEIIALLADDKYVTVHHSGGTLLIEDSLRTLEQTHPERWLRLHRSCLVPRERLLGLNTLPDGRIVAQLAGSALQPEISRRNLASVRAWLRNP